MDSCKKLAQSNISKGFFTIRVTLPISDRAKFFFVGSHKNVLRITSSLNHLCGSQNGPTKISISVIGLSYAKQALANKKECRFMGWRLL